MHLCKIGLATEGKRVPGLKMPMAQVELRDSEDGDPVLIISWGKRPVQSLMIRMDDIREVTMTGGNLR